MQRQPQPRAPRDRVCDDLYCYLYVHRRIKLKALLDPAGKGEQEPPGQKDVKTVIKCSSCVLERLRDVFKKKRKKRVETVIDRGDFDAAAWARSKVNTLPRGAPVPDLTLEQVRVLMIVGPMTTEKACLFLRQWEDGIRGTVHKLIVGRELSLRCNYDLRSWDTAVVDRIYHQTQQPHPPTYRDLLSPEEIWKPVVVAERGGQ